MALTIYKDSSFKKKWNDLTGAEKRLADKEIDKFVSQIVGDHQLSNDFRHEIAKRLLDQTRTVDKPVQKGTTSLFDF
ncbi:hypothetical protein QFZ34_002208 [Phyllobacterium ifriqiyense]|uniref:Uncharacterized protein n=1 Tax=Phyllobacterium ifriqiyense TaxID=314238 RepID=A0ABU0S977_9HYPH|nr:hypothetical protein [Phyllobacterium ifriqiyense]MDQ0997026.1 hypothetical protein [Phyllobacterium ifriqiyense]